MRVITHLLRRRPRRTVAQLHLVDVDHRGNLDGWPPSPQAILIARRFHAAYEAAAPAVGYRTRAASAVPWEQVPATNRDLMALTVQALLDTGVIEPGLDLR